MKANRVFFPNLDGLRFFCFLAVFLYHSFATDYPDIVASPLYQYVLTFYVANGALGVNFFFVLSGFLITFLLFTEKERFSRISIGNFYLRRILRIWPLFFFCVFFGFIIFPYLKQSFGEAPVETANPLYYLTFLNNIDLVNKGLPDSSVLVVLWSVAIEEQFYFVWPIILALVPVGQTRWVFLAIIAFTFVFRYVHAADELKLNYHTFSCISDMAVGGLFAYLAYYRKGFLASVQNLPKHYWVALYAVLVGIFLFRQHVFEHNALTLATDRLVCSIIFGLVIMEQNYAQHSLFKMSRFKWVSKWGTYTYGLYCLHMIGILVASQALKMAGWNRNVYQVIFLEGFLSLAITMVMAYVSYHFYEKRFLKLKDRFALVKTSRTEEKPVSGMADNEAAASPVLAGNPGTIGSRD